MQLQLHLAFSDFRFQRGKQKNSPANFRILSVNPPFCCQATNDAFSLCRSPLECPPLLDRMSRLVLALALITHSVAWSVVLPQTKWLARHVSSHELQCWQDSSRSFARRGRGLWRDSRTDSRKEARVGHRRFAWLARSHDTPNYSRSTTFRNRIVDAHTIASSPVVETPPRDVERHWSLLCFA